jgi:hypothetical protein
MTHCVIDIGRCFSIIFEIRYAENLVARTKTPLMTVVETAPYLARAQTRMTGDERLALIDLVAARPDFGVLLDGGIRKVRFGAGSRGKSGRVRVIYLYADESVPIFLLTVFAKNEQDNLDAAELKKLVKVAKQIAKNYKM